MKAEEFKEAFLVLSENEQMSVLRKLLPVFWRTIKGDPKKVREMFSMLSEECGGSMANMISMMEMRGRKGGSCCG